MPYYKPKDKVAFLYICYNENCKKCDKQTKVTKNYEDEYKDEKCKGCKKVLTPKGIYSEEPFTSTFSKISLMTKKQKTALMKKRSKNHFNKEIAEKKRDMDANIFPRL